MVRAPSSRDPQSFRNDVPQSFRYYQQSQVEVGLNLEIATVTYQVDSVMRSKQAGEAKVQARLLELDRVSSELRGAHSSLTDLMFELASSPDDPG